MAKAPFYRTPGGGRPSLVDQAQIAALAKAQRKATAQTSAGNTPGGNSVVTVNGSYTATSPLRLSGFAFSIPPATVAQDGFLTAADWVVFSTKEAALGNPAANGAVLASTTDGVRSWATFVDGETPAGTIDGANTAFTLAHAPIAASIRVYKGASTSTLQRLAPTLYSVTGSTLTFTTAPATGAVLLVDYRY